MGGAEPRTSPVGWSRSPLSCCPAERQQFWGGAGRSRSVERTDQWRRALADARALRPIGGGGPNGSGTWLAVGGAAARRRRRSRGRFGCAVLAVPAVGGGGGGASSAARAGKRLGSAPEFWSRRARLLGLPRELRGAGRPLSPRSPRRTPRDRKTEKMEEGGGGAGTGGDGGAGGEQLLTVKHELRTGERPRPLPAGPGAGARPEVTRVRVPARAGERGAGQWSRGAGPCGRGGSWGVPGGGGAPRGERAESFPEPENELRALDVGARGAAHSCLLALVSEDVFGPRSRTGDTSVTASCLG